MTGARHLPPIPALVALAGAVAVTALTLFGGPVELMQADTDSYLHADATRTPGYPLFLRLVAAVRPTLDVLPWVQAALLIAAAAWLAGSTARLLNSRAAGLLAGLAIVCNPFVLRYTQMAMTESLFLTLLAAYAALVLAALRQKALAPLATASAVLGAAILVRPVGYALLCGLPVLLLAWRRQWLRAAMAMALPATLIIAGACGINWLTRGYFATQVFGGVNVVGQVAHLIPEHVDGVDQGVMSAIHGELAGLRQGMAQSRGIEQEFLVGTLGYNPANGGVVLPRLKEYVVAQPERFGAGQDYWVEKQVNAYAWVLAKAAIAAEPLRYARQVLIHVWCLWMMPQMNSTAAADDLAVLLGPLQAQFPFATLGVNIKTVPVAVLWIKRLVFALLFVWSMAVLLGALLRRFDDPRWTALAFASLSLHASFFLVAGVESGLPRYALGVWPLQAMLLAGVVVLFHRSRGR